MLMMTAVLILGFVGGALVAALTLDLEGGALARESYSLAITDVEGPEQLPAEWGSLKEELEATTGDSFEFLSVESRTAAVEALRAERMNFVVTDAADTSSFIIFRRRSPSYDAASEEAEN